MIRMIHHKASQNARIKLHTIFCEQYNTIPNPRPHDHVITKTELICHHKDGTHRQHITGAKYAVTKTELIAVTKTELNNCHKDGC